MATKKGLVPQKRAAAAARVSQGDVPACSVTDAMRVVNALNDDYAGAPTAPLRVASAMGMQPNTGKFRMLTGAAIAYGLASGGAFATEIALTQLGRRAVRPLSEGDDAAALREAFLRPRVIGDFLKKYNSNKFPRDDIAKHVLEDMGVPRDRVERALTIIKEGAEELGLFARINNAVYVDLGAALAAKSPPDESESEDGDENGRPDNTVTPPLKVVPPADDKVPERSGTDRTALMRTVYLTHGKNRSFIDPLKRLLSLAELDALVSVETQTTAVPVPQKIMQEMRTCGAAIIHVDDELRLIAPTDATEQVVLNPNVLIEIGAAMALYGDRFILLVKEGVNLPSNLQGLYKVFYTGEALDGATTIRLLEAIASLKKKALPSLWLDE